MTPRLATAAALCALAAACGRPPAAPSSGLGDAVRGARDSGPCRAVVAGRWPAGWPVPLDVPGKRRFKIFFYPLSGAPPASPRLATPAAEAVVDADAGKAVECRLLTDAPRDLAGPRWTPEAGTLDSGAFDAAASELDALTEAVARAYAARRPPNAADSETARRYVALFERLAEPPLLADYYRLNPDFWEWTRRAAGGSIAKP